MEMMAVDPIQRVVVPRFLGGVIAMPLLAAIFSVIGIYGAQLVGVQIMGVDSGSFWSQMRAAVGLSDINEGIVKSCISALPAVSSPSTRVIMRRRPRRASVERPRARWSPRRW
jgi:phospholipid/cholesterol/gamma-HCH transport system permease protein